MKAKSVFAKVKFWLQSQAVFVRIVDLLPGGWELYEYYFEKEDELVNWKEADLKVKKQSLILSFQENDAVEIVSNLSTPLFESFQEGCWKVSKNYLIFNSAKDSSQIIEFQFALVKGELKLLKKDADGKILFFGFFRRSKPGI